MPVSVNQYFFGNSLVNYSGGSAQSNVPYWMDQFASAAGNSYAVNGGYGFLRQFADRDVPSNEWGFRGVDGVWDTDTAQFDEVTFDSIILTPSNFIQDRAPDSNYFGEARSPLDAAIEAVRETLVDQPTAQIYVYEGWADLGSTFGFPISDARLDEYHAHNAGAYHDWFVSFTDSLDAAVPNADVQLIPVASTLAGLFLSGPLDGLMLDDLYLDSAPHATETVYFLASMITYRATFGEAPPAGFDVPDTIHPLVAQNFDALNAQIDMLLDGTAPIEPAPIVVSNEAPVAVDDEVDLSQDEVAIIDVLANDSDPDGGTLALTSVGTPSNGTVEIVDGRAVYTPDTGFAGSDSFSYTVSDGQGASVQGSVDLQVAAAAVIAPDPEPAPVPEPIPEPVPEPTPDPTPTPDPSPTPVAGTEGFAAKYFEIADDVTSLSDVDFEAAPVAMGTVESLQYLETSDPFVANLGSDLFAAQYETRVEVTESGFHEILLVADDFAQVLLDGDVLLDTSMSEPGGRVAQWVDLDAGSYDLEVRYIEIAGEQSLKLDWFGPSTNATFEPMTGTLSGTEGGDPVDPPVEDVVDPIVPPVEEVVDPEDPPVEDVVVPEEPPVEEVVVPDEPPVIDTPLPQTVFSARATETDAAQLSQVNFANAGSPQDVNGVTLASENGALLAGGPEDGAVQFTTSMSVETAGLYTIGLSSDNEAQVAISGLPVINANAGDMGAEQTNTVFLIAGSHNVDVRYLDAGGAQSLNVTWSGPDTEGEILPLGDVPMDAAIMALISTNASLRSDEAAFEIAMNEADELGVDASFF